MSNLKKYIEIDYPVELVLTTSQKLKPFKYGCKQRTKILRDFLRREARKHNWVRKDVYACHQVVDYIVEAVIRDKSGNEICWIVGS